MVSLVQIILHLHPGATPLVDFSVSDDGGGPKIAGWDETVLGPQPSLIELESYRAVVEAAQQQRAQQKVAEASNASTLESALNNALDANLIYTNTTIPTAAQSTSQIKALTRQMNGLIRLQLKRLEGTN